MHKGLNPSCPMLAKGEEEDPQRKKKSARVDEMGPIEAFFAQGGILVGNYTAVHTCVGPVFSSAWRNAREEKPYNQAKEHR